MTLGTAVLLLLIVFAGMPGVSIFLREKRLLRLFCIIGLVLLALALAGYIALTLIFVNAVENSAPFL